MWEKLLWDENVIVIVYSDGNVRAIVDGVIVCRCDLLRPAAPQP